MQRREGRVVTLNRAGRRRCSEMAPFLAICYLCGDVKSSPKELWPNIFISCVTVIHIIVVTNCSKPEGPSLLILTHKYSHSLFQIPPLVFQSSASTCGQLCCQYEKCRILHMIQTFEKIGVEIRDWYLMSFFFVLSFLHLSLQLRIIEVSELPSMAHTVGGRYAS